MAGTIGDLIWKMAGKEDPRQALLAQAAGVGTPGTPPAAPDASGGAGTDPATAAPAGSDTVATGPMPEGLKSTPDMVGLYTQMMDKQNFSDSINHGLGLILSSMAYDENKASIQSAFGVGGGGSDSLTGGSGGDALDFLSKTMKLREDQSALAQKAAHRAALPAIAKQYGLDLETAQYLFDSGKLDAVIQEAEKPNKQLSTGADGRPRIVDLSTGEVGAPIGPEKKREIEVRTDTNTGRQFAVYKDDGTPVGGKDLVAGQRKTEVITDSNTGKQTVVYADDKSPVPDRAPLVAGVRKTEYLDLPDGGKRLVFADDKSPVGKGDIASIGSTDRSKLWHDDMVDRAKRGLPEIPMDDWLKTMARSGANDANSIYGSPPTDMAWKRDDKGEVIVKDGTPVATPIEGTKLWNDTQAAKNAGAGKDELKKMGGDIVVDNIDRALKVIDDNSNTWLPVTGIGGLMADLPLPTDAGSLADKLDTVKANIGFDKLNAIRASNTTGGGLGPISDFENKLLQATYGSLRQTGQEKDIKYNLNRVKKLYTYLVTRPDNKPITDLGEAEKIMGGGDGEVDPAVEALISKYGKKKEE